MARAVHCDRQGCDTWQVVEDGEDYRQDGLWTSVQTGSDDDGMVWLFCCMWCAVVELSRDLEPTETIAWDEVGE